MSQHPQQLRRVAASVLAATLLLFGAAGEAHSVTLYSVRPKDTIARIARSQGVSVERLLKANSDLGRSLNLKVGQIIIVPDRNEMVVKADDDDEVALRPAAPRRPVAVVVPAAPARLAPAVAVRPEPIAAPPAPAPVESVALVPMPVPTPVAQEDMPSVTHSASETIAVLNEQVIRLSGGGASTSSGGRRPQLASRRGRLLTQITSAARRFMGVPYVWGGTTSRGYDCSGFTMTMYRLAGIPIKRLADEQFYQGKATSEPLPGDLVFFTTYLPGPSHVGIFLGNNLFIHASSRRGVTISSLNDAYFKKRYLGARRFF